MVSIQFISRQRDGSTRIDELSVELHNDVVVGADGMLYTSDGAATYMLDDLTGERHEGMFYSLVTLFRKIAVSVVVPLALLVLQATGYVSNAAVQPTSAINGIRILMGPIPAVLLLVGVGFAFFYPLNRQNFAKIRSELVARRAAK